MREIKFRGYNFTKNKMIPFEKIRPLDYVYDGTLDEMVYGMENHLKLMQYTGLKDKNGLEIYEGDILKLELDWGYGLAEIIIEVYFKDSCFRAKALNSHEDTLLIECPYTEIVGNIYENPELLEQK